MANGIAYGLVMNRHDGLSQAQACLKTMHENVEAMADSRFNGESRAY